MALLQDTLAKVELKYFINTDNNKSKKMTFKVLHSSAGLKGNPAGMYCLKSTKLLPGLYAGCMANNKDTGTAFPFLYLLKTSEKQVFLRFSRGVGIVVSF